MAILGLNVSGFHSSACLIEGGEVLFAVTEERLTRIKNDKSFPLNAIKYCLSSAGLSLGDVSDVYVGWNPSHYLFKADMSTDEALKDRGKLIYLVINQLAQMSKSELPRIEQLIDMGDASWRVHFVDHHKAHLMNSVYSSGYSEADFFIADGWGEVSSGIMGKIADRRIDVYGNIRTPHSLGSFYSAFTDYLGFKPNSDEWKVMALASLGDPDRFYSDVRKLIKLSDYSLELDLSFFEHYLFFTQNYFSPKFEDVFGVSPKRTKSLKQAHYDLVASLQKVVEDVTVDLLGSLHKKTDSNRLLVGGGFFMNSVLNGKLVERTPYEMVEVGGSPDDSGVSIGSAFYGAYIDKRADIGSHGIRHNYFGRSYEDVEIRQELIRRKLRFMELDDPAQRAAELISSGRILAWYQGRSEFGQRALGNRSILADPTRHDVKDLVNTSIKYREGFRPFAPACLKEFQSKYFDISGGQDSYFMERVFRFKSEYKDNFPGVVHFDGTGRLQTVDRVVNPEFYDLISKFHRLSGSPIVLNTSFNVNGMPLVETPADALNCFYMSGIDAIILGHFLVEKM